TAHHVAHVQFRHLVVGHVLHTIATGAQLRDDGVPLGAALADAEPYENLGGMRRSVTLLLHAIVELRDAALAEQLAEPEEAERLFRNFPRQQGLTLAAEIRTLGNVAQA